MFALGEEREMNSYTITKVEPKQSYHSRLFEFRRAAKSSIRFRFTADGELLYECCGEWSSPPLAPSGGGVLYFRSLLVGDKVEVASSGPVPSFLVIA